MIEFCYKGRTAWEKDCRDTTERCQSNLLVLGKPVYGPPTGSNFDGTTDGMGISDVSIREATFLVTQCNDDGTSIRVALYQNKDGLPLMDSVSLAAWADGWKVCRVYYNGYSRADELLGVSTLVSWWQHYGDKSGLLEKGPSAYHQPGAWRGFAQPVYPHSYR